MEFLTAGLPDDIRRLVEIGDLSLTERRIKKLLEDERLPDIIKERLL
jgi:hypothetical protein